MKVELKEIIKNMENYEKEVKIMAYEENEKRFFSSVNINYKLMWSNFIEHLKNIDNKNDGKK
jgi:hypothetical protein